jgi:GNAT superfamily N-acetyltransferase
MKIVPAGEVHVPGIIDCWEEFADFHRDIDPRYPLVANVREGFGEHLKSLMADDNNLVLVAVEKGRVVGHVIAQVKKSSPAFKREKFGFIDEMAVRASYRRRGVGAKLLAKILDWFRERGIDMIELDVAAANEVGYPFWKKHGFKAYLHRLYRMT